jgi:HAMP domain-containing protein
LGAGLAWALATAGLALAAGFFAGAGLRAALRVLVRLGRTLAEEAALAFPEGPLLRTGRLADGIFWTLLKN